jgi:hypothetical protein
MIVVISIIIAIADISTTMPTQTPYSIKSPTVCIIANAVASALITLKMNAYMIKFSTYIYCEARNYT